MNGDLKLTFIQRTVNQFMEETMERIEQAADLLDVNLTGEGIASLSYTSATQGAGVEAALSFNEYLRFVDMGVGRGHPLGGLQKVAVELKTRKNGVIFKKDNKFKTRRFYSRVAYGKLTPMYNRLLYGFTEETIAMLKAELQQANNQII